MRKVYLMIGFFLILSGCAGIQVANNASEAMQLYGPECAKVGYQEGTDPYTDCIFASWNIAVKEDAARRERASMFLMMMGQGMQDAGNAYSNTYNSWRSPTYTNCYASGNTLNCTSR